MTGGSALAPPRALVALLADAAQPMLLVWGASRATIHNDAYAALLGPERRAEPGRPFAEVWIGTPAEAAAILAETDAGRSLRFDHAGGPAGGHLSFACTPVRGDDGAVAGMLGTATDITRPVAVARRAAAAAEALRESEERFRHLADNAPVMVWVSEPDGRCTYLSQSWYAFTGQTPETGLGFGWLDATHPDDRAEAERVFLRATAEHSPFRLEYRLRRADGTYRWAIDAAAPRMEANGRFLGYVGSVIDITERRQAEERLMASEAHLAAVYAQMAAGLAESDLTGRFVSANDRYCQLVGRSREELLTLRMQDITHPDDLPANMVLFERMLRTGAAFLVEKRYIRPDGSQVWVANSVTRIDRGDAGSTVLATSIDVTELKRAETALREALLRFEAARRAARLGIYDHDMTSGRFVWDERLRGMWGLGDDDPVDYGVFLDGLHPDDRDPTHAAVLRALDPDGPGEYAAEYRVIDRRDGTERWIAATGQAFFAGGRAVRLIGSVVDVTGRRRAEETLARLNADLERRIHERTAQLVQSQKMEAIGQLTGGVAHDFNNLLQGIGSCLYVLRNHVPDGRPHQLYDAALRSVERGGRLTQHLLAFARRQTLAPKPTDLGLLLDGMRPLLERTLGGLIHLDVDAPPGTTALVDPAQLESAILNLVINARDAMPDGGTLSLRAGRGGPDRPPGLAPGDYATITVRDTGVGMDEDTLARVFEPFFTTKGVHGSGLGLSMVHGMAAQSGGGVHVASRAGAGTTVALWLPAVPAGAAEDAPPVPGAADGAGRSVLLVDDDAIVRLGVRALLEGLGYQVMDAGDGEAALAVLRRGGVDALVTDYAMPGLNGATLVREARRLLPGLPAVIITGYADVPAFADDVGVLHKPFLPADLETRLESLLGRERRPTAVGG